MAFWWALGTWVEELKIAAEYDGDHHRMDRRQFTTDIHRAEIINDLLDPSPRQPLTPKARSRAVSGGLRAPNVNSPRKNRARCRNGRTFGEADQGKPTVGVQDRTGGVNPEASDMRNSGTDDLGRSPARRRA